MKVIAIDKKICTGCQECVKVCPAYAIQGEYGEPQQIDSDRCIMCGHCVQACKSCVSLEERHEEIYKEARKERGIPDSVTEPLFAAYYMCHLEEVKQALADPNRKTFVQCAPAVRMALAEEFGYDFGYNAAGKLAAALRRIGFDRVYDTNFSADLTIMEEGTELIKRVTEGGVLPMFTSCCPAWVKFLEQTYPELIPHLSSCKSPQQMLGAVFKTYGCELEGYKAEEVCSVSVMPCTCKEFECNREEMSASGQKDVDVVITTRELAWLMKERGIDFDSLPEEGFDQPLGEYSGAGNLFGITGGVMEAAIRTGYELLTGKPIEKLEVEAVRGTKGYRRAQIQVGNLNLRVGVVTGLSDIIELLEQISQRTCDLHFIEVMTCPEGCVSGGGQPKLLEDEDKAEAYAKRRAATLLYDQELPVRKSHENPAIQKLYKDFLDSPCGPRSHHLLHTTYINRQEK